MLCLNPWIMISRHSNVSILPRGSTFSSPGFLVKGERKTSQSKLGMVLLRHADSFLWDRTDLQSLVEVVERNQQWNKLCEDSTGNLEVSFQDLDLEDLVGV